MNKSPASIDEIRALYEKAWPVQKIASHLGMTRQAVYERMRREGFEYRSRKGVGSADLANPLLARLHIKEGLTIAEIARRLGYSHGVVSRAFDRFGIERRKNRTSRETPGLRELKIGDQLTIETSGEPPFGVYSQAKRLNMRVVSRRLTPTSFAIIRTPLLNPDTVRSLLEEGKSMKQIAQIFFADYRTIKKLVR